MYYFSTVEKYNFKFIDRLAVMFVVLAEDRKQIPHAPLYARLQLKKGLETKILNDGISTKTEKHAWHLLMEDMEATGTFNKLAISIFTIQSLNSFYLLTEHFELISNF